MPRGPKGEKRPADVIGNTSHRSANFERHERLQVSERLLGKNDGPMLESLKRLNGETIHLPGRIKDRPDRDRLALRFERFKAVA
jgi:hypothetical protein